jgi:hypothetical protein
MRRDEANDLHGWDPKPHTKSLMSGKNMKTYRWALLVAQGKKYRMATNICYRASTGATGNNLTFSATWLRKWLWLYGSFHPEPPIAESYGIYK